MEVQALVSFALRLKVYLRYPEDCFCIVQKDSEQLAGPPEQSGGMCHSIHLRRGGGWQTSFPGRPRVLAGPEAASACTVTLTQAARYVNFSSVHPAAHKSAVMNTLLQCATRLC